MIERRMGIGLVAGALMIAASLMVPPAALSQSAPDGAVEEVLSQPDPLSDREMKEYAESVIAEVNRGVATIQKDADQAKKDRDILKLNCLNQNLSELRALLKIAETAFAQMEDDISKARDTEASHQFRSIVIVRKQAADLIIQASECTGEGILQSGEGQTNIVVSSNLGDIEVVEPDEDIDSTGDLEALPPSQSVSNPN